jgi:hypothetical protein
LDLLDILGIFNDLSREGLNLGNLLILGTLRSWRVLFLGLIFLLEHTALQKGFLRLQLGNLSLLLSDLGLGLDPSELGLLRLEVSKGQSGVL